MRLQEPSGAFDASRCDSEARDGGLKCIAASRAASAGITANKGLFQERSSEALSSFVFGDAGDPSAKVTANKGHCGDEGKNARNSDSPIRYTHPP